MLSPTYVVLELVSFCSCAHWSLTKYLNIPLIIMELLIVPFKSYAQIWHLTLTVILAAVSIYSALFHITQPLSVARLVCY
jgi:hypothetical protein